MLEKLIHRLQDPHTRSLNDLAHALDTTTTMIETMLEDLERMGYVRQVKGCDQGCHNCQMKNACTPASAARIWSVVGK